MSIRPLGARDAEALERCLASGGVAVFPADTVYGLACDPGSAEAVARLYRLKVRRLDKPSAVMLFSVEDALAVLPEVGPRARGAIRALLPGGLTLLLANPGHRFAPACGTDPSIVGLRVPALPSRLAALGAVRRPLLQSSANAAGGPEARTLATVPEDLRNRADLLLDGGELPGTPSTVLDMREYEDSGSWRIVRAGAVSEPEIEAVLGGL